MAKSFIITSEFGNFLHADGFAYGHAHWLAAFLKKFTWQPRCAEDKREMAEKIKESGICSMEINRYHRHFGFADDLQNGRLPLPVDYDALGIGLAYSSCRKKTYWFAAFQHGDCLTYAGHGHTSLILIGRGCLVDGNEVGPHGRKLVENHIDHHLKFRS